MFRELLVVACWAIICQGARAADNEAPQPEAAWGSVAGRVVFEGDLNDPVIRNYEQNLEVDGRIARVKSSADAFTPAQDFLPNMALLIDHKTRGVANAVVYLRRKPDRVHPALSAAKPNLLEAIYDRGLLLPRMMVLEVGQTVRFSSRVEKVNFAVASTFSPVNVLVEDKPYLWKPTRREPGPIRAECNFRPTALAFWLVVDHPYAAVTGHDGSFEIENLPAGEVELAYWHEAVGFVHKKLLVAVTADEVHRLPPVAITLERLKKP